MPNEDYDYNSSDEEEAKFNMAIDTLKRLGKILAQIRDLTFVYYLDDSVKQKMKIELTKQFFIQASPLLPEDYVNEKKGEIIKLKPKYIPVIKIGNYNKPSEKNGSAISFSWELDNFVDLLLIEIEMKMQEKDKYFKIPKDIGGLFD